MKTADATIAALVMASSLAGGGRPRKTFAKFATYGHVFRLPTRVADMRSQLCLIRIFRTPGPTANMQAILPPSPPPPAGPSYPERYATAPPPPPQLAPPQMTRDEEREKVIRQGEAFCQKYPDDKVCHPLSDEAPH